MSDNIKVVVKVRPLISREIEGKLSYQWRVKNNTLYQLDNNGREFGSSFTFDKVYDNNTKTSDIYNDIAKPIVEAATAGFNGTIFAYGQTSSGKTYTMSGTEDSPGIIPLAVFNLFQNIKSIPDRDFLVRVSYIEIYNETVKDLLNVYKNNIKVHENLQGIKLDCTEQVTTSPEEVLKYLKEGEANRQTGATNMNEESSRSHSIFQITIESREHIEGEEEAGSVNVSTLNLVDLAGSERAGQTGATGIRFKEGTHINKSLSALALVIKQLSEDQNKHVNYRDSKLTRILQNSLGGNAKTSIICAITPAAVEETISTLQFANRAKAIKNKPEVNAVATEATMIQSLTKQLSKLQSQLEKKKNLEVILESKMNVEHNLQKQIAALQRLILNGFGTRSSLDMLSSRRPLVPPRRITISTLHPIEENPAPPLPKFHTPLLKYNPMVISGTTDFVPIQNTKKLTCVTEETDNRLVTPPPHDKKVNFSDEIIELDSDDDASTLDGQTCSPYHKCYGSSKTPPCVLRKNAKVAEKNLKDIVELTEREKIYSPNVVELIEKLEQNTTVITSLQDEVNALHKKSRDKDLELDQLQAKVSKSNEEIKSVNESKAKLEALCQEYTTKLTDWEVSYETLQNKTKRREQELLSLLEDQKILTKHKRNYDINKSVLKTFDKELNFIDMSKDISLVNSDNESSIVNNDDETSSQFQDLVTDMQNQMTTKNESVLQLQADLLSREQTITLLENSSHQMQSTVDSLKEKLALLENENSLLKSTLDTLNSTIKSQKSSLESAHSDIESYNSLIQELQIKLTNKEKVLHVNINDSTIENMVANEEKFIANNENMKNLIHCFKIALNSRNKEIQLLKSNVTDGSSVDNLKEQLIVKETKINVLNNKATALQEEIKNNLNVINKLMEENTNLLNSEHQLTNKLKEDKEKHCEQNKINLESLESIKAELTIAVADKDALEKEMNQKNEELIKKIQELQLKIDYLNQVISSKDDLISSLDKEYQLSKKNLLKLKSSIAIVNTILENLNIEYKDSIDDSNSDTFDILEKLLTILESKVVALTCQKNLDIESNLKLRKEIEISNCQLKTELVELQSKIVQISEELGEYKKVVEQNASEYDYIKSELELKESEILTLKTDLSSSKEDNEKLCSSIKSTEKEIATMLVKENSLSLQMQILMEEKEQKNKDLTQQINALNDTLKTKDNLISDKDIRIHELVQNLKNIQETLEEKILETEALSRKVQETIDNENLRLENICKQSCKLIESLDLKHDYCSDYSNVNLYQNIILRLEQISNYIERMNGKNPKENESLNKIILEARQEIEHLTQFNKNLQDQLSVAESSNNGLLSELNEIKSENKQLNVDLMEVSKTLDILRNELKEKATDIEIMVTKTQNLKEHFMGLDCVMKNQTKELIEENENLKTRCCELEFIADNSGRGDAQSSVVDDINDIDGQTFTKSQCDVATLSIENQSPPSLLTICCSKIIDAIQPSEKSVSSTNSKISVEPINFDNRTNNCNCSELLSELKSTQFENLRLSTVVEQLESLNQHLIIEHEEVRREVQLLLKPANELQKKISSHKTNLSTLTATTYAENKSLQSQVTSLQHHHNRFHNVCQKDLPVVKKQLCELLTILKSDNSYTDKHNASFKRFSLPSVFDNNSTLNNLKNESTLDGDLLMLDTNMTLTTSGDNTLMGIDHTCLDITQVYPNNDVACQTADLANVNITENNANQSQMESLFNENEKLSEEMNILEQKNIILNKEIEEKASQISNLTIKTLSKECETCCYYIEKEKSLNKKIEIITQELSNAKSLKADIEEKYNNLTLEMPSTEALVRKINSLERDWRNKAEEVTKLTNSLNAKNSEIKQLQQEIDSLSTQVMENISESDDLTKELESVKESNTKLLLKCTNLEELHKEAEKQEKSKTFICPRCQMKNEAIKTLQNVEIHSKLNRSLSDSETSSRHNKICTLQNELHAGRQDCKELTEEVATIKSHLDRSNLSIEQSMDLDESMGESNIFTFTKQFESIDTPLTKLNMPNVHQDCELDVYTLDKLDCINYIVEKTGANKENLDVNMKVIDLMKMFYGDFLTKHNHEVENFVNKLKCYEESRSQLESHVNEISSEYSKVKKTLEQKENNIKTVTSALSHIRQNISLINEEMSNFEDMENKNNQLINIFKDNLLKILDAEFGLTSVVVFEKLIDTVVNKHQNDLMSITDQYTKLQTHMESVTSELNTVNNNLLQMKCQLSDRENEYNLLKAQKERVHEISNAVTLDIIRKEQELCDVIEKGCKKLVEHNIMCSGAVDMNLPVNKNLHLLFERIITDCNPSETEQEKENLMLEIKKSKSDLEENIKSLETLKVENDKLNEINKSITLIMVDLKNKLKSQESSNKDINSKYDSKVHENETNILKMNKMTDEIKLLKDALVEKENIISKLESVSEKEVQITELMNKVSTFNQEIDNLKSINEIIIKEKETCALELDKCKEVIKNNNEELCKMTSDILVLRESVKENVSIIESLKEEAKSLFQQNLEFKDQLQEKCKDFSRLEMNIKTHEKTAEIQSRMIIRLQKQKEDDDKAISEKSKQVDELTQRYADLQKECETIRSGIKASVEELETLKHQKETLEQRLSGTESSLEHTTAHRPRLSIEAVVETTRRRRQSIHDSKRMFTEGCGDHNKIEAMFNSRPQPQDLFMDVDEDSSNGSTPLRTSRGRDSLISRNDQSEKDDDPPSRPSSVAATRRRRQSIHDLHRSIQTPSPHERPSSRQNDTTHSKSSDVDNNNIQSEVAQLRESLSSCQQELEELKEQYRELDEECETCSQYLREREEQCSRLKKEKAALANLITELQEKLANPKNNEQERKRSFADAYVNTDEDWANLHSVVVDRMSFDAEVDKNKRLTKTIEELRFQKQDLKNTLAKMQKALEKYAARDNNRELEATKSELRACKQELMELKEKYMELDVECETCSQYLREREEQCRKLKEAKAALEAKLQEYEDASNVSLSLRSKRRTMHDQRRARPAATGTTGDFLTYQVELDGGSHTDEVKLLKSAVDKLSKQKAALEQQLVSVSSAPAPNPMYIATGSAIVQNQQLTDVMKENQKLKKINAKLVVICKKRGKKCDMDSQDISEQS